MRDKVSFYVTHKVTDGMQSEFGSLESSERYTLQQRTPQQDRKDTRGPKLELGLRPTSIGLTARGKKKKRKIERQLQSGDGL